MRMTSDIPASRARIMMPVMYRNTTISCNLKRPAGQRLLQTRTVARITAIPVPQRTEAPTDTLCEPINDEKGRADFGEQAVWVPLCMQQTGE